MMSDIEISILMSVYNEKEKWLIEAIDSILNQSYKNFEFIIILDNPNNNSLRKIIESYKLIDERIKFFINNENKGLVPSLNRGLREAKGKYIARIDADDIATLDRIEKQFNFLKNNKEYTLLGSGYRIINEESEVIRENIKIIANFKLLKLALRYRNIMCHPSYMFVKDEIIMIGGYREVKFAEDYDLIVRLILNGKKITNINERLLYYRIRQNGVSKSNSNIQRLSSYLIQDNYIKKNIYFKIIQMNMSNIEYKFRYYKNKILYKTIEVISNFYE